MEGEAPLEFSTPSDCSYFIDLDDVLDERLVFYVAPHPKNQNYNRRYWLKGYRNHPTRAWYTFIYPYDLIGYLYKNKFLSN